MLDENLISQFAAKFFGYGTFDAPVWFVGMEEGGGNDIEQVAKRLAVWKERGCLDLEDLEQYHRDFGVSKFWKQKNPPTQPTWNKLIRLLLAAKSNTASDISLTAVKEYQREQLGKVGGTTCLLELLPLPSPSKKDWWYREWSEHPQLRSRKAYEDWLIADRIHSIRSRIHEHQPAAVIFYGSEYQENWQKIVGGEFERDGTNEIYSCQSEYSFYLFTHHPRGARSKSYWHDHGRYLADSVPTLSHLLRRS